MAFALKASAAVKKDEQGYFSCPVGVSICAKRFTFDVAAAAVL